MTEQGKIYVLTDGRFYLCISKGKTGGKQYWGNYIGTAHKRYGAERFDGGEHLDIILKRYPNLKAVEVKK